MGPTDMSEREREPGFCGVHIIVPPPGGKNSADPKESRNTEFCGAGSLLGISMPIVNAVNKVVKAHYVMKLYFNKTTNL